MIQMVTITAVSLLMGILSPAIAQDPGDVGSAECREAQLAVYSALESEGPPKNNGQMMKIVNRVLNAMKKGGAINGRCAACVRTQFAHEIPLREQQPCGLADDARAIMDFASGAFERIRDLVDPSDTIPPTVRFVGNHIEVASDSWVYVFSAGGRQVFRPTTAYPHIQSAFSTDIGPILDEWSLETVPEPTVDLAREVALTTVGADYSPGIATKILPARELLTTKCAGSDAISFHEGRTMVRFRPIRPDETAVASYRSLFSLSPEGDPVVDTVPIDLPPQSYETAVTFAPAGHPMRIESSFATPAVEEMVDVFRQALERGSIDLEPYPSEIDLKFGAFFSAEEPRFELTAYSYEGEKDLDPRHTCWEKPKDDYYCNPFEPYEPLGYCYNSPYAPDVGTIRSSDEYWATTFEWWNEYWRTNGIRGNWYEPWQSWVIPGVDIEVHADLADYGLVDDSHIRTFETCEEEEEFPFWHSVGNKLDQEFYDDLESAHVVMINTHGGPIWSRRSRRSTFQFMRNYDDWVTLRDDGDDGLGTGRLRHLFLEACSGMNWRNNWRGAAKNLAVDWLNDEVGAGIRTIAGYDGGRMGWRINGWRFFGHYNVGESVSQAWFNMALDEYECHAPVVVAYGDTELEAAQTLFDGRFSKTAAGGNCAMVSGPLTEELLAPRACCRYATWGPACVELSHSECEAIGGQPLDPCTNCADDSEDCAL